MRIRGNRHPARNPVSVKSNEQGVRKTTNYVSKIRSLVLNLMGNKQFFTVRQSVLSGFGGLGGRARHRL